MRRFLSAHRRGLIAYCLVGAFSAIVYFLSFRLLWGGYGLDYRVAVSIAYLLSVAVHFVMNRTFTFNSHGRNLFRHVARYLVMLSVNYVLTLMIMNVVVSILGLSPYLGIIVSIGLTMGTGYVMAKYWVFHEQENET